MQVPKDSIQPPDFSTPPSKAEKSAHKDPVSSLGRENIPKSEEDYSDLKIKHLMVPMESGDPFQNTDLLIFKDEYTGIMPLNGIRESEFKEIKEYYAKFLKGEAKFKIEPECPEDDQFKAKCEDMVKLLLTRKLGRDLISELESSNLPEIKLVYGKEWETGRDDTVKANTNIISHYYSINPQGERILVKKPLFITLAHELTHMLHDAKEPESRRNVAKPNLSLTSKSPEENLDNLEEQLTITGLGGPLHFEEHSEKKEIFSLEDVLPADFFEDFETAKDAVYDRFNENNFLAVFSTRETPLPPRLDHRGLSTPSGKGLANLNSLTEEDFKSQEFRRSAKAAIDNGLIGDMKKILACMEKNGIDIDSPVMGNYSLLQYASLTKKPEIIVLLKKKGAKLDQVDVSMRDPEGNTPLHAAILYSDAKLVRRLLKLGSRISDKNGEAATLEIAWKTYLEKKNADNTKILVTLAQKASSEELRDFYLKGHDEEGTVLESAWRKALQDENEDALRAFKTLLQLAPKDIVEKFYEEQRLLEFAEQQKGLNPTVSVIFEFAPQESLKELYEEKLLAEPGAHTADWYEGLTAHVKDLNSKDNAGVPFINRMLLSSLSDKEKAANLSLIFTLSNLGRIDRTASDAEGNNYLHAFCTTEIDPFLVVKLSLARRDNVSMKNHEGLTPIEVAEKLGKDELQIYLEEYDHP